MPLPSAFNPSLDVSFVIKNNSSIGRSIKVFNTRVPPGGTIDVMKIPGVTEEDIRSELTKGSLRSLFSGGSLTVISSSVNFSSIDGVHGAFLRRIGLSSSLTNNQTILQSTWYIDPVNGNDANTGSLGSPLKTHNELTRRIGPEYPLLPGTLSTVIAPIQLITINVLGNLPASDPVSLHAELPVNCLVAYVGTPVPTTTGGTNTGTFTAVTPQNRATNTPWSVTDVNITWASHIGKRLRITSGPNTGQIGWIAKDLGAGTARISTPTNPVLPAPANAPSVSEPPDRLFQSSQTQGIFSVGDTFVIEDLTTMTLSGDIDLRCSRGGAVTAPTLGFANFEFRNSGGFRISISPTGGTNFIVKGCRFQSNLWIGNLTIGSFFLNCGYDLGITILGNPFFLAGLSRGSAAVRGGAGGSVLDVDIMFQGAGIDILSGGSYIGTACVFDRTTSPVRCGVGAGTGSDGNITLGTLFGGTHALWGSGSTDGYGVNLGSGCTFRYDVNVPTITSALGDLSMTGLSARAWDEAGGAYTALRSLTWTNIAATIGGGGFGGNAHNVERNIHFVKLTL